MWWVEKGVVHTVFILKMTYKSKRGLCLSIFRRIMAFIFPKNEGI